MQYGTIVRNMMRYGMYGGYMPKFLDTMTEEEWSRVPVMFGTDVMTRVVGTNRRYVIDNAPSLGGVKIGGKWLFSKAKVAEMLGI